MEIIRFVMAYDKKKILKQTHELIEKHGLLFIEDIIALLPLRKQTFYDMFPVGSDEMDSVKSALEKNRVSMKSNMRQKWYKSDNPTLQVALMKIIANEDEAARLSGNNMVKVETNKMRIVWGNPEPDK
jgi:hypothetical protein